MVTGGKASKAAADAAASVTKEEAQAPADQNAIVKVKNTSKRLINISKGGIEPGKKGEATVAELRQFRNYLEKA